MRKVLAIGVPIIVGFVPIIVGFFFGLFTQEGRCFLGIDDTCPPSVATFNCDAKPNGENIMEPSQDALNTLSLLRSGELGFKPITEVHAPGNPFDNMEFTAGSDDEASIQLDLWRQDGETPWGNSEISTLVHHGESIRLADGFTGRKVLYSRRNNDRGWQPPFITCELTRHLGDRNKGPNNMGQVIYMRITNDEGNPEYYLYRYNPITKAIDPNYIWKGQGKPEDESMIGVISFVPSQVLVERGLAYNRK